MVNCVKSSTWRSQKSFKIETVISGKTDKDSENMDKTGFTFQSAWTPLQLDWCAGTSVNPTVTMSCALKNDPKNLQDDSSLSSNAAYTLHRLHVLVSVKEAEIN